MTLPKAYHTGFSHGFNVAEAVNFAMGDWFQFAADAHTAYCQVQEQELLLPVEYLLCTEVKALSCEPFSYPAYRERRLAEQERHYCSPYCNPVGPFSSQAG